MANVFKDIKNMNHKEWLLSRRQGIGGSDVGSIVGVNNWRNSLDVYLDKVGEIDLEEENNEFIYWGTVLEDIVAKEFCKRTGKKVRKRNSIFQHEKYPFMLANIDREVIGENAGLECKTANAFKIKDWEQGIPESYELQCHHYMAVMGYNKMYIACLIGGNKFIFKEIYKDDDLIKNLEAIEFNFWHNNVLKKIPPVIQPGDNISNESLMKAYPCKTKGFIKLSNRSEINLYELDRIKQKEKELKEKKDNLSAMIKQEIAENEGGVAGKFLVSWKEQESLKVDTKKLKEQYPDVFCKCSKPVKTRVMRINKPKEDKR